MNSDGDNLERGYTICEAQSKMKMQSLLLKNYLKIQDGTCRVISQARTLLSIRPCKADPAQDCFVTREGNSLGLSSLGGFHLLAHPEAV